MGKSRSNRSNRKTSERLRMALLYVFCCGRRGSIDDVEADKMTIEEEMRKAQDIIYGPSKAVKGIKIEHTCTTANSKDDITPQKILKRPAPKRPSPDSQRPQLSTKSLTEQQGNDCKRETDEASQHGDTLHNVEQEQNLSTIDVKLEATISAKETKPLEDYPEYLNPFADGDDAEGRNAAGNNIDKADDEKSANDDDGINAANDERLKDDKGKLIKETTTRTIEDYPEELNPYADDKDVLQDEAEDAGVGK